MVAQQRIEGSELTSDAIALFSRGSPSFADNSGPLSTVSEITPETREKQMRATR
jgi:hypothetical protein